MTDKATVPSSVSDAQQQLTEFSQTIFTDLQHDFHELNHEITKDSVLEPFRHEYAKLFGILQKSMTNIARYVEKGRVIESEIVGNKAKVKTVSKLSEEDSRTISNLSDERDKKQAILQECLSNLHDALEENEKITSEIQGFESELEKCVLEEKGHKDELAQLKQRRTELMKHFEELNAQVPQLQEINRQTQEKRELRDKEITESLAELKKIEDLVDSKQKEDQNERQRLFELERDREATKVRLKETLNRVKEKQSEVSAEQESVNQLDMRVLDQKRRFESARGDKLELEGKCQKLQKDLDQLNLQISSIENEINVNKATLDERQSVCDQLKKRCSKKENEREKARIKLQGSQDKYEALRKETDGVRSRIDATESRIETLKREGDFTRKQIDAAVREENTRLKRKEGEASKQNAAETLLAMYKNQTQNVESEISSIKAHLHETQKKINAIDSERMRYSEELSSATSYYLHAQDVLRDIEQKVATKNQEIMEGEKRVAQQQSLYETVRSEREIYSKKVKEVEAEITELESNFSRMKFAIEQHKEDIHRKDAEKMRDIRSMKQLDEEDNRLREKLADVEIMIGTANSAIVANEAEIGKINVGIKAAESELSKQQIKLDEVKHERDAMSNKNVEKEIEMRDITQKLEVLKKQCKRGEKDYDTKEQEIERIKALIRLDSERLDELSKIDDELASRRETIHHKQKLLMQLRAERAAMEDELAVPINIHRWTLLESSDPAKFEKLKRYQELQADLVARTKEVTNLQEKIKQRENEYAELNSQLRRRPGLENEQRASEYSEKCKAEKFSLDRIMEELNMYRNAVKEYRKELSDVQCELINQRNKWIRRKKKDLKIKRMAEMIEETDINQELQFMGIQMSEKI